MKEVFESIRIIRQCLDKMEDGPLQLEIKDELPVGRIGLSSVEAPRGESHHFVITGENNRPRRWRVRAPTYQNLQGVPAMIKDQQIADMTISLGSIDPVFFLHRPAGNDGLALAVRSRSGRKKNCSKLTRAEESVEPWIDGMLWTYCGRSAERGSGSAAGSVLPGSAAQDHGAHPVAARPAAVAALFRSAETARQGGHRIRRDAGHAAIRRLSFAGDRAHRGLPRADGTCRLP